LAKGSDFKTSDKTQQETLKAIISHTSMIVNFIAELTEEDMLKVKAISLRQA